MTRAAASPTTRARASPVASGAFRQTEGPSWVTVRIALPPADPLAACGAQATQSLPVVRAAPATEQVAHAAAQAARSAQADRADRAASVHQIIGAAQVAQAAKVAHEDASAVPLTHAANGGFAERGRALTLAFPEGPAEHLFAPIPEDE